MVYAFFFQTIEGLDGGIKTGDAPKAPKDREGSGNKKKCWKLILTLSTLMDPFEELQRHGSLCSQDCDDVCGQTL